MPKKETLRRITVDERLHDSLIRLLFADPDTGAKLIPLGDACTWSDEKDKLATPENVLELLGIAGSPALLAEAVRQVAGAASDEPTAAQLWNGLAEGMTFVIGRFEPVADEGTEPYAVKPLKQGEVRLLRIDTLAAVKEGLKSLYASAVSGQPDGM